MWITDWTQLIRWPRRCLNRIPTVCLLCGRHCRRPYSLCEGCEDDLPRITQPCTRCGVPLPAHADACICGHCLRRPPTFDLCRSPFLYASPVSSLIAAFKYQGELDAGYSLSKLLAGEFADFYWYKQELPDCLLPVPLHPRRRRQRGFNQALEIARVIAGECRLPLATKWVYRRRHTTTQAGQVSVQARRRNVSGAFHIRRRRQYESVSHIALIDDVVTTKATVEAISRCLRSEGIDRIDVWCLARAER